MRLRRVLPILVLAVVIVAGVVYFGHLVPGTRASSAPAPAPAFTLTDIYGHNFTLSSLRNGSVVVIEFTSLSCAECQVVEKSLSSIYSTYNQTGTTDVRIVSVYINPQFGDTIPALQSYH